MRSTTLPQIIPTLNKLYHKIISIDTLKQHIQLTSSQTLKDTQIYKIIYHLKSKWYVISCKKDLFYIKPPESQITQEDIIAQRYHKLLKQHCTADTSNNRYIWGISALEYHYGASYLNTDEVIIINDLKTATEVICFDKTITYKSYRDSTKSSIFPQTKKYATLSQVGSIKIRVANLELAIIESLYSPSTTQQAYTIELVRKLLKKHKKTLNWSVLEFIIKLGKFHSSYNRLYQIAQQVDSTMADIIYDLIKRYSYVMEV